MEELSQKLPEGLYKKYVKVHLEEFQENLTADIDHVINQEQGLGNEEVYVEFPDEDDWEEEQSYNGD